MALLASATQAIAAEPAPRRPQICEDAMNATHRTEPIAQLKLLDLCLATGTLADKDQAAVQCKRGEVLMGLKYGALAGDAFDRCVALAPDQARGYAQRSLLYARQKEYDKALRELKTAIRLDGKDVGLRSLSGSYWCSLNQCERSLPDLDELVRQRPNEADGYCLRAWAYAHSDRLEKSLVDYDKALELNPAEAQVWTERGLVFTQLGENRKALADMDEAIRLGGKGLRYYTNRGAVHQKLGQWREAIADYKTSLSLEPGEPYTLVNLAWVYATCPDTAFLDGAEAVRLARQAWTCKHLTAMLDCLAAAYARAGNFDEAAAAQAEVMARMGKEKKPPERLKQAQARLELYKSGQPYTDTDAPTKD